MMTYLEWSVNLLKECKYQMCLLPDGTCYQNEARFEKPIPRRKVGNFASAAITIRVGVKNQKRVELQGTRNHFGWLIYLNILENIKFELVFKYPVTPTPLSLARLDETRNKTEQSKLFPKLEDHAESEALEHTDVSAVDAAVFLLHSLVNPSMLFRVTAQLILQKLYTRCISGICACFRPLSQQNGPGTVQRKKSYSQLQGPEHKNQEIDKKRHLSKRHSVIFHEHQVFVGLENICYSYHWDQWPVSTWRCSFVHVHDEAENRILHHMMQILETQWT